MFKVGDRVKFVGKLNVVNSPLFKGEYHAVQSENADSQGCSSVRYFADAEIVPETDPFEDHDVRHFIDTLKRTIEFREADIAALKDKIAEMEDDSSEDEGDQKEIFKLAGMLGSTVKLNLELFDKGADLARRNAALTKVAEELAKERDNSRWEVSNLLAENEKLKWRCETAEKSVVDMNRHNTAFAKSINAALKEKFDLQFENASLKGCSEVALKRADALQAENQKLLFEIKSLEKRLADLEVELGDNKKFLETAKKAVVAERDNYREFIGAVIKESPHVYDKFFAENISVYSVGPKKRPEHLAIFDSFAINRIAKLEAENQNLHSMIYVARTDLKDILRELDGNDGK